MEIGDNLLDFFLEDLFLMDIYERSKSYNCELQSLKIDSGNIESCNFDEKFSERVLKILKRLHEIKKNYNGEEFDKEARIVLENIFKRKYYEEITSIKKDKPSASIRSFVKRVYPRDDDRYDKWISLCDSLHIEMHDNPKRELTTGDMKCILDDFFYFLKII